MLQSEDVLKSYKQGLLEIDRYRVPYRIYGENKKISLLIINGVLQSMGVWRGLIPRFIDQYNIVLFDFPGQGKGEIVRGERILPFEDQITIIDKVVKSTCENNDIYMLGASWGAIEVARYAGMNPNVKKIILGSFGAKLSESLAQIMIEGKKYISSGDFSKIGDLIIHGFGELTPDNLKEAIRKQFTRISKEQLEIFYAHCEFVEGIKKVTNFVNPELIKAKTLIINGEKDTIVDLADIKEFSTRIPNCTSIVVKDAGHFMHFENPSIADYYVNFFNS